LLQPFSANFWQPLSAKLMCISCNLAIPEMHVLMHQKKLHGDSGSIIHNSQDFENRPMFNQ
jgi:hypothetical protein